MVIGHPGRFGPGIFKAKAMVNILEYDGIYKVAAEGKIYKDLGHHIIEIKPCINSWGYLVFSMSKDGIRKMFRLHRVVAFHFVNNPNPEEFDQVNHLDGNKLNCASWNLEWTNNQLNNIHKVGMGLNPKHIPRIGGDIKKRIIELRDSGAGPCNIAKDCGVSIHSVYRII